MDRSKREALYVVALLACVVILVGCKGPDAKLPESDTTRIVSVTDKRAGLLEELDRRFQNPDVHFDLGQSYRNDGLWTQAEYHFEAALRFDPAKRPAQAAMVKLLTDSGHEAKASARAETYVKQLESSWKETLKLGNAFREEGVDEHALACYQQAVRLSPESPGPHKALGYYYLSKNNKEAAKEYFKQSFRLDPSQAAVAGELGLLGVAVRVPRDAENQTEKAG